MKITDQAKEYIQQAMQENNLSLYGFSEFPDAVV